VSDLIREALGDTRELVRIEIALAREDLRSEVRSAKVSAGALGAAAALFLSAFALGMVAIVLGTGGGWVAALVLAGILLAAAAVFGLVGWRAVPSSPFGQTRDRLQSSVELLRERAA
jgi:hypothetical protein